MTTEVSKIGKIRVVIIGIVCVLMALITLSPFYILIVNSFKPLIELASNPASLPKEFTFNNFKKAYEVLNFEGVLKNTVLISVPSVIGMNVISAMAAHRMVRRKTKFAKIAYFVFVAAMIVPFQSTMVALTQIAASTKIINSIWGMVILYWGLGTPFNIFLFHGFIKGIPYEIEEAAIIDGCSPFVSFFRIVYPLLSTVSVTVLVLNTLWVWNDFLLPLLMLPNEKLRTIPLAINTLFGTYAKQWDLAMAGLLMAIAPIVILFLCVQRYVVEGVVAGSVKG